MCHTKSSKGITANSTAEQSFKFPTIISRAISLNSNEYLMCAVHKLRGLPQKKKLYYTEKISGSIVG
jgi:hypothetical protein